MNNPKTQHASQLYLSLVRDTLPHTCSSVNHSASQPFHHQSQNSQCALWLQSGALEISDKPVACGQGIQFVTMDNIKVTSSEPAVILRFIVSRTPIEKSDAGVSTLVNCDTLFTQAINVQSNECILRLDQVDFPPAAVAYKHTHPGPGIRYLVEGGLTLVGDHGQQTIAAGDAWFEDANSAVEATAVNTMPSRFVRTMLLPLKYEGRSTFTLHNKSDADKPMRQTNIRHFEKRIWLDQIH